MSNYRKSNNRKRKRNKTTKLDINENTWDALLLSSFNFEYETGGAFVRKPLEFFKTITEEGIDKEQKHARRRKRRQKLIEEEEEVESKEEAANANTIENTNEEESQSTEEDSESSSSSDDDNEAKKKYEQVRSHYYRKKKTNRKTKRDIITQLTSKMAQQEHQGYQDLPLFGSLAIWHHIVGPSIRWYFTYLHTAIVMVSCMCAFSLGFQIYAVYLIASNENMSIAEYVMASDSVLNWMTPTNLPRSALPVWIAYACLNLICCCCIPLLYRGWVHRIVKTTHAESRLFDAKTIDDPHMGQMGTGNPQAIDLVVKPPMEIIYNGHQKESEMDRNLPQALRSIQPPVNSISESMNVDVQVATNNKMKQKETQDELDTIANAEIVDESTRLQLKLQDRWERAGIYFGRFASWSLFIVLLSSYATVQYFANVKYLATGNVTFMVSLGFASGMVLFNVIWNMLASIATGWEHYASKAAIARSYFFKTAVFRICSSIILYGFSMFTYFDQDGCPFNRLGQLYISVIPVEIFSALTSSVGIVFLHRWLVDRFCRKSRDTDHKYMPDFVLAEQLDNLLDNTFLLLIGSVVFFPMPFAVLILMVTGLLLDRIKIKYFIRPVVKTNNTFMSLLIGMTIIRVLIALTVPPIGILWIFFGFENNCSSTLIRID